MIGYKVHISFGWKLALYLVSGLSLFAALIVLNTSHPLGGGYSQAILVFKSTHEHSMRLFTWTNALLLAVLAVVIFIVSLVASHRVAGPVYRMVRSAEAAAGGDFTGGVKVRHRDSLHEAVHEMDTALRIFNGRITDVRSAAENLSGTIQDLNALEPGETELSGLAGKLKEEHDALDERLSFFHTA